MPLPQRRRSSCLGMALGLPATLLFGLGLTLGTTTASAVEKIGRTAISRNIVQEIAAKPDPITVGDDVFANEGVRTGTQSAAKFVFSDETNLALGETSSVKLDKFVYSGETSYVKAAVNFTAGAFRFTTGGSDKGAYQLKTSTATIGVRGTVFDLHVVGGETTITLVEGAIDVCPRKDYDGDPRKLSKAQLAAFHCVSLTAAGQTAVITARRAALKTTPFSFADATGCGAGLCTTTTTAELTGAVGTAVAGTGAAGGGAGPMCYMKQD